MDNRSAKVKAICDRYFEHGCRVTCPLADPCRMRFGDTKEIYDVRLNAAAEGME